MLQSALMNPPLLKLTFINGLKDVAVAEIERYSNINVVKIIDTALYIEIPENLDSIQSLKSITGTYLTIQGSNLNPHFISKHKSILGSLIEQILKGTKESFKTYKLSCAGSDTKEVKSLNRFIGDTYKLIPAEDADMEIYIGKQGSIWEIGVRSLPRPLSVRDYRVANIPGGLNSTVAYAMNTYATTTVHPHRYLNIFSGSATLLLEAVSFFDTVELVGFDANGKTNALAIQNIKKAGKLKSIQLKTADIFSKPQLGTFDSITSDLPFGMKISKGEDIEKLYRCFVEYCEESLASNGTLVVYTTEHELLKSILLESKFIIHKEIQLKIPASLNAYIYPKIFVCGR